MLCGNIGWDWEAAASLQVLTQCQNIVVYLDGAMDPVSDSRLWGEGLALVFGISWCAASENGHLL